MLILQKIYIDTAAVPRPCPAPSGQKSAATYSSTLILPSAQQDSKQPRNINYRMPHGFDKLLHHEPEAQSPPTPPRCHPPNPLPPPLRQQPYTRACGAGDRHRPPPRRPTPNRPNPPQMTSTPIPKKNSHILQDPRLTWAASSSPSRPNHHGPSPQIRYPKSRSNREKDREKDRDRDGVARTDDPFSTLLLSGKAFMSSGVHMVPDQKKAVSKSFGISGASQEPTLRIWD